MHTSVGYEFDTDQKKTIDRVGMAFKALGLFVLVTGAITGLGAIDRFGNKEWLSGFQAIAEGLLLVVTSRFLRQGANSLDAVAKKSGDGIPLLMEGFTSVRGAVRFFGFAMLGLIIVRLAYIGAYFAAKHFGVQLPTLS
jgi:hypothetical protein